MPSRLLGRVRTSVSFKPVEPERGPGQSFGALLALGLYEAPCLASLPWVGRLGLVPLCRSLTHPHRRV